jgi:DNA-binding winged helix-turn-helix (wHTH) protein
MVAGATRLVYASGECEVDLNRRELRVLRAPAPVGGRAFEIMEVLVHAAGELVSKDELMEHVWPGAVVLENTLQVHIASLRRALGPYRALLKTESGRGYRLLGTWTARNSDSDGLSTSKQSVHLSDEARADNFPLVVTNLIGRAASTRSLRDLISAYRVVTLTGPGGIGKTALAIETGRGVLGDFKDGGRLVELASLADAGLVPSAVASVLGLRLIGGTISAEAVARAIGDSNLLLILDNCEHVVGAAAELAEAVVRFCPRASVLATSREVLRIDGEQVYRVPPLDVPEAGQENPEQVLRCGAVELLVARTRALDSGFSTAPDDIPSIVAICRHLDGIPLAIEFAAARAATLGLRRIAVGLGDRFRLLTSGRRTALPRHQTLRAALDWSYELLRPDEQWLLRHLAIFPGAVMVLEVRYWV